MITILAICILGGDDVFQFNTFKYFKIHVCVLLSFYVVMIAKEELSELDKIAVRENIAVD